MKKIIVVMFLLGLPCLCFADWAQDQLRQNQQFIYQTQMREQAYQQEVQQQQVQRQNEQQHREVINEMRRLDTQRQDQERMNQEDNYYNPYRRR